MMKVGLPLKCYYPSQAGGQANALYWLNCELADNGVATFVTASDFGLDPSSDLKKLSRDLSSEDHKVSFVGGSHWALIKKSAAYVKKVDVVQLSSFFLPLTLPLLFMAIMYGKSIVLSPRGELYDSALLIKPAKKKIWLFIIKSLQRYINFHVTCELERDVVERIFPHAKSIVVIANFIKLPEKVSPNIQQQFIFLGRINPIKNIDVLVEAFGLLVKTGKGQDIELVIAGSARLPYEKTYLKELSEQIERLGLNDKVVFKGHLDGGTKNIEVARSLALILPSKSENFGNVVLEALAQSTPVIASKGTPWSMLEDVKAGFWVDADAESLYCAMRSILDSTPNDYKQLRDNAFILCSEKFDIKSNVQLWIDYYQKITNHV